MIHLSSSSAVSWGLLCAIKHFRSLSWMLFRLALRRLLSVFTQVLHFLLTSNRFIGRLGIHFVVFRRRTVEVLGAGTMAIPDSSRDLYCLLPWAVWQVTSVVRCVQCSLRDHTHTCCLTRHTIGPCTLTPARYLADILHIHLPFHFPRDAKFRRVMPCLASPIRVYLSHRCAEDIAVFLDVLTM